jgi:hypothetical protein
VKCLDSLQRGEVSHLNFIRAQPSLVQALQQLRRRYFYSLIHIILNIILFKMLLLQVTS